MVVVPGLERVAAGLGGDRPADLAVICSDVIYPTVTSGTTVRSSTSPISTSLVRSMLFQVITTGTTGSKDSCGGFARPVRCLLGLACLPDRRSFIPCAGCFGASGARNLR